MNTTMTPSAADPSNRRAHRRIPSAELPEPAQIRIPNRPAISLVDLSAGGALLELPFPIHPESRVTLEVFNSADKLALPFRLLRCYVADLTKGLRYHAAGTFDQTLTLPPSLSAGLLPKAPGDPLIEALAAFLRNSQTADLTSRGARFNELLSWVVTALERGESATLVLVQIKANLARLFPSLAVFPASTSPLKDQTTCARFFGLDFKSEQILGAPDRRFLRASAQLITLIQRNTGPRADPRTAGAAGSSMIVRSMAEWQEISR